MSKKQKNNFSISGKVLFVAMPIYYTERMSKRFLVMEVYANEKFRQEVNFDYINDNMDVLNNIREGDWVNITYQLRGRKFIQKDGKTRWFTSLEGTSCTKED